MNLKHKFAALGVGAAACTVTSVAFAAWTSTGDGSGRAQSTTSENSTIVAGTLAADLYPGATKSVTVVIDNTNDDPVIVTSISAGSSDAVNGCAAASVTSDARSAAAGLAQVGGTLKIAANSSGTYDLTTHMVASPSNACKSQTFNLPLTADLESAA